MASKSTKTPAASPSSKAKSSIVQFAAPQPLDSMEKIMSTSKNQFEKFKTEASVSGKQGLEACVKSGTVMAQGMEQYIKTIMAIAQSSAERQGESFKQLLSCKTLNEMTEAQNKIAQENFEEMMQAATKLSEISIKIATDVFEPISEEINKTVKKASDSLAA